MKANVLSLGQLRSYVRPLLSGSLRVILQVRPAI
jgi:hypothetical protein